MSQVMIAFPSGGMVTAHFASSLAGLCLATSERYKIAQVSTRIGYYVHANRNQLVEAFLTTNSEWLLQLDSDLKFQADLVYRLLGVARAKDGLVVAGWYLNNVQFGDVKQVVPLSNSACLHYQPYGYILWGIEDGTRRIVGTKVKPKTEKFKNEPLENWLITNLNPKVSFCFHETQINGQRLVLLVIDSAKGNPISFDKTKFVRFGSSTRDLKDFPDKERQIWESTKDWSADICAGASIGDLHPEAIQKARELYSQKNPEQQGEVVKWDDITFLNKIKLAVRGELTRAAVVLLGLSEATSFLSPSQAQITWVVYDSKNTALDYKQYEPPFLLQADKVLANIRNLIYRYLPDGTLFPETSFCLRVYLDTCVPPPRRMY